MNCTTHGERWSTCLAWVFFQDSTACDPAEIERARGGLPDVQILLLASDVGVQPYLFWDKVQACAHAEAMPDQRCTHRSG